MTFLRRGSLRGRALVATAVTLGFLGGAAAPAHALPSWTVVDTPSSTGSASLLDVSCASATHCFAVGAHDVDDVQKLLIEHWNGTHWSVASGVLPSGGFGSQLKSVHCVNSTTCFAVGQYDTFLTTNTLIERWDGHGWSILPSPNPPDTAVSGLSDVQCTSPTRCFAVGSYFVATDTLTVEKTLVEHWDGSKWKILSSPNKSSITDSSLSGVWCTNTSFCFAVGQYRTDVAVLTLIEQWNGKQWAIVSSPNPTDIGDSELAGISCMSSVNCFAVGFAGRTLVEHWNGSKWSITTTPNPAGANVASLSSISCPAPTRCYAAGNWFRSLAQSRLVETWNGTAWRILATPAPTGAVATTLNGISCPVISNCLVVGDYAVDNGPTRRPLVEHYA